MTQLPLAQTLHRHAHGQADDTVILSYEGRFLRRKKLVAEGGLSFVVDLEQTTSLDHGDCLELEDGRRVQVQAAPEEVLIVTGPALAQLAWHIGNRHTPCQIEPARLVIQNDPVIAHMLRHLGAQIVPAVEPFTPEGGAYGHGRTHAHAHGHTHHAD
ncbi:MAG: urease accessory protein UreE [Sulfitobacter sp.]